MERKMQSKLLRASIKAQGLTFSGWCRDNYIDRSCVCKYLQGNYSKPNDRYDALIRQEVETLKELVSEV